MIGCELVDEWSVTWQHRGFVCSVFVNHSETISLVSLERNVNINRLFPPMHIAHMNRQMRLFVALTDAELLECCDGTSKNASYGRCHETHKAKNNCSRAPRHLMRVHIIRHLSSASSRGRLCIGNRTAIHLSLPLNDLQQMTECFLVFSGQEKICVVPARSHRVHLSVSNIWLLVQTFLCLKWVNSKNYITALLTVSVCVLILLIQKAAHTQGGGGLVHI